MTSKFTVLLAGGVIIAAVALTFLFEPGLNQSPSTINPPPAPSQGQSPIPSPATNRDTQTEKWTSYTNQSIGFSIKHPADWYVYEKTANGYLEILVQPPGGAIEGTGNWVTIASLSIRQFGDCCGEATVIGQETTPIGGLKTYSYIYKSSYGADERVYYINRGDKYLVLRTALDDPQMDLIVSTFQLTN